MSWIDEIIGKSTIVQPICPEEHMLVEKLINTAYSTLTENYERGLVLASLYDLAIASVYYTNITNAGWMFCRNDGNPKLLLPFVNCCPIHALKGDFVFHKSGKPTSGKIGVATSRILLLFFDGLFKRFGQRIEVYKASEPADAILLDRTKKKVFFAEIKASPLLTMSLATDCDLMTETNDRGEVVTINHKSTANPTLIGSELYIMIPVKHSGREWKFKYYPIGKKANAKDDTFAYKGLLRLLSNDEFIIDYLDYWVKSFEIYCKKDSSLNIFWFTNACGRPNSLSEWETSISDSKTSVGMDRTDDIKKGIYQILKLGSEGKNTQKYWDYKVGILSNIHPARHFDAYIKPIKDLIWTTTKEYNIHFAKDLPSDTPMFNLFDGIVTFTDSYVRDGWLSDELFSFLK